MNYKLKLCSISLNRSQVLESWIYFTAFVLTCKIMLPLQFAEQNRRSKPFELNVRTEIVQSESTL